MNGGTYIFDLSIGEGLYLLDLGVDDRLEQMEFLRELVVLQDKFVDAQLRNRELEALLSLLRHAIHTLVQGEDALENQLDVLVRASKRTRFLVSSYFMYLTLVREPEIIASYFVDKIKTHL